MQVEPLKIVEVDRYTRGVVGPSQPVQGPVSVGGRITSNTAPGCWGPMITPHFKGGHEVTQPVAIDGAEVGDGVALRVKRVEVTSRVTASGTMKMVDGRFVCDPFVDHVCGECGAMNPSTTLEGTGRDAVRCASCGAPASSFEVPSGYTIAFDHEGQVGITLTKERAEELAGNAAEEMALPGNAEQHPISALALSDVTGVPSRLRPFLGNVGSTPARDLPDSHNAGDFGQFLIGADHEFSLTEEELAEAKTDGHMDVDSVREGAVLICPTKVAGAGIYIGDMHANQGDGEIAGHTTDVSGEAELEVAAVIKGLQNDGPILLPPEEDLPFLAKPFTEREWSDILSLARSQSQPEPEPVGPVQTIGSGADLNAATDNGLERMSALSGMDLGEVMNRVTIAGGVEIGRHPGVVTVTMTVPMSRLEDVGLAELVRDQYGI
ncbi:acetamidase/formamidase family protein [Rubrobacter aplysinae]|uniref:acetamidase/formamidase family protein n=1 Tax=Rubrobacter aplysinae TaxID=909625 RepID=UPI0019106C3C|nr:acetamidase/formamidase family protein [Rubrobacter aplysinae]